jgi:hypothetical protein
MNTDLLAVKQELIDSQDKLIALLKSSMEDRDEVINTQKNLILAQQGMIEVLRERLTILRAL